jgi:replication-associated recombination protein RarA
VRAFNTDFNQWPTTGSLLLVGESGSEGQNPEALALQYARKILSENSDRSGILFDSKTHTDFQFIMPEPKSQWIKIDQIRELIEWASGKPQIASKQVAIISPAHSLNIHAANALLKTLEESSPDALFILVTDRPSFIPATIRSRCYWIRCRGKDQESIHTPITPDAIALKAQITEDLDALKTKKTDPVSVGIQWIKHDPKQILHWLLVILQTQIKNAMLQSTASDKALWRFLDKALDAKRELEAPNQPNTQLLMESLLIEYSNL